MGEEIKGKILHFLQEDCIVRLVCCKTKLCTYIAGLFINILYTYIAKCPYFPFQEVEMNISLPCTVWEVNIVVTLSPARLVSSCQSIDLRKKSR